MSSTIRPTNPAMTSKKKTSLVLAFEVAGETLTVAVDSWDELMTLKNKVKPYARFNREESKWIASGVIHDVLGLAKTISEVFKVPFDKAKALVERHNEMVIGSYREKVKGTGKIISLYSWLPSEVYYKVTAYASKKGYALYEFSPTKFVLANGLASMEEYRARLVEWLDYLGKHGFILDPEAILGMLPDIMEVARRIGTIKATISYTDSKHGKRVWVRLEFNRKVNARDVMEWLLENASFKYNYPVFEGGNKELKNTVIRSAFRDRNTRNVVYIAGWFYQYAKEFLEKHGFWINESELPLPSTERVIEAVDITSRLRPYQREALEAWIRNKYRGAIAMPTGAGKTWVGLAAISMLGVRTVIFVPTINLANQWKEKIAEVLGVDPGEIGILGGGHREIGKPILVALYDSGVKYSHELGTKYALYIFDEGHHVAAFSFKEIAWNMLAPYRMVLSATIERDDKNEEMIYKMCGNKVYEVSYDSLVGKGYLAPVEVSIIGVGFPQEEREEYYRLVSELASVKARIRELYASVAWTARAEGYSNIGDYLRKTGNPEYKKLNKEAMSLRAKIRTLEQRNSNKVKLAIRLAEEYISEGRKTFVFTNLVRQAEAIYKALAEKYPGRVAIVTGKTKPDERNRIFREFREGSIQVIVTTTVLDEGIDAPASDAAIVVSSRAIVHPRQFIQRIGRIVRPMEGKKARVVILRTNIPGSVEGRTIRVLAEALAEVYGRRSIHVEERVEEV